MKLTPEDFIQAGYKKFQNTAGKLADFGLQKLFADEHGKRYYLTVWAYDWKDYPNIYQQHPWGFEPDVQFTGSKYKTSNVQLIIDDSTTVKEIEDTYEAFWEMLGKPYYEFFDDYE